MQKRRATMNTGKVGHALLGQSDGSQTGAGSSGPSAIINQNSVDESVMGVSGLLLGFTYGIQYNPQNPGNCYDSMSSILSELDLILSVLS